jgi:hypothetical protein
MKYLKTFENFDLGPRFTDDSVETDEQDWLTRAKQIENEEESEEESEEDCEECDDEETDLESKPRVWGDEVVEKKKVNAGFQAYLDKQKAKKGDKKEEAKGGKKSKPDFLDLDKDGDKKEPMKKAAKDAKEDDKGGKKGLTAGQKKLPEAMQKAILKKQK